MSEAETRAAFITAALVLLVMPMVYVVGLSVLMLIVSATSWAEASGLMFALALMWGVVVIVGILMAARRLIRRSARG
jgi:threonine/homoserine/homoserine lactone efflux protein